MSAKLLIVRTVIFLWPVSLISALLVNSSVPSRRSIDGSTDLLNRQYPFDMSFILPHLIVGVFIPIAVIIGIGVVLMKLFIIGFMLLGRGGYNGLTPNMGATYPWRVEQQQIQRSLGKDGSFASNYLSETLWQIIGKFSNSLEKYQKYKN